MKKHNIKQTHITNCNYKQRALCTRTLQEIEIHPVTKH